MWRCFGGLLSSPPPAIPQTPLNEVSVFFGAQERWPGERISDVRLPPSLIGVNACHSLARARLPSPRPCEQLAFPFNVVM